MLSTFDNQQKAVSQSIRDIEKELARTDDEDLYNELLTQKNSLGDAYETLGKIKTLVNILHYFGV